MPQFQKGHVRAAKLSPSQVHDIRTQYAEGRTQGSLARAFGVSVGQVGRIVRGEAWVQFDNPAADAVGPFVPPTKPPTEDELNALGRELLDEQARVRKHSPLDDLLVPDEAAKYLKRE